MIRRVGFEAILVHKVLNILGEKVADFSQQI